MENYELYHAGVKGMKWGVRKSLKSYGAVSKRQSRINARKAANEIYKADEAKRRKALKEYTKDIYRDYYTNRGKRRVQTMISGAIGGLAISAAYSANKRQSGKAAVVTMLGGSLAGAVTGNIASRVHAGIGKKVSNK